MARSGSLAGSTAMGGRRSHGGQAYLLVCLVGVGLLLLAMAEIRHAAASDGAGKGLGVEYKTENEKKSGDGEKYFKYPEKGDEKKGEEKKGEEKKGEEKKGEEKKGGEQQKGEEEKKGEGKGVCNYFRGGPEPSYEKQPKEGEIDYSLYGKEGRACLLRALHAATFEVLDRDKTMAATLLRMSFHDCLTRRDWAKGACDASVLLPREINHPQNENLRRAAPVIYEIRERAAQQCNVVPTKADTIAAAGAASIDWSDLENPEKYGFTIGRRDRNPESRGDNPMTLPLATETLDSNLAKFWASGHLDAHDSTLFTIGGHSIGRSACEHFSFRLNNQTCCRPVDPTLDPRRACKLTQFCRSGDGGEHHGDDGGAEGGRKMSGDGGKTRGEEHKAESGYGGKTHGKEQRRVHFDFITPFKLDTWYFKITLMNKGLLTTDHAFGHDPRTAPYVKFYAHNQQAFDVDYIKAFIKVSLVGINHHKTIVPNNYFYCKTGHQQSAKGFQH
ncbi:Class III Peroxidase [Chara braunii]|uniref:Class III Peroxidase n=1 Tax=Chara braunii TaxID=69332 RepID=A0A388M6R2_CHABU|nr:Class III Peroxidase [Chara braunii]GBG90287.1 Class III Peroxidase [Chara braunii]|eukprot:GBG90285.1 Class III Peroxidase [Chara braunii]